jgi:hypothetical protein
MKHDITTNTAMVAAIAAAFKAVDASTSDEELLELVGNLMDEAEQNGYTFEPVTLIEWMAEHRESLEE